MKKKKKTMSLNQFQDWCFKQDIEGDYQQYRKVNKYSKLKLMKEFLFLCDKLKKSEDLSEERKHNAQILQNEFIALREEIKERDSQFQALLVSHARFTSYFQVMKDEAIKDLDVEKIFKENGSPR